MSFSKLFDGLKLAATNAGFKSVTMDYISFFQNNAPRIAVNGRLDGYEKNNPYPCLLIIPPSGSNSNSQVTTQFNLVLYALAPYDETAGQGIEPGRWEVDNVLANLNAISSIGTSLMDALNNAFTPDNQNIGGWDNYKFDTDIKIGADKLCYFKAELSYNLNMGYC